MLLSDFDYDLPEALIAQAPLAERAASRMLLVDPQRQDCSDRQFTDLVAILEPGDLLVFNDTRVIPARLFGRKSTGGKVEVMVERIIDNRLLLAHLRASKAPKAGSRLILENEIECRMTGRDEDLFVLEQEQGSWLELLERYGHVPLPPYIQRGDENSDRERYQTVYASTPGAVAAPTAGLHFDNAMLEALQQRGVVDSVAQTRAQGGRVIAVGTTVVRSLETAAQAGELDAFDGDSRLFIKPGFHFRVVDAMLTNFHLPRSTLLMLVSAFAGAGLIRQAYAHAVAQRYRFFSYGDAMFIANRAGQER